MQPRLISPTLLVLTAFSLAVVVAVASPATAQAIGREVVLDAIVATVDEKPITLSELSARLHPPRKLTLQQASEDHEAQQTLEAMILEKLLEEEARSKRVSVSDEDLDEYIDEVSARNNLSREAFEKALAAEGKSLVKYRQQVKLDILRAKLAAALGKGGTSVTDKEIDDYLEDHPELRPAAGSVRLRQIVISSVGRDSDEFEERVDELAEQIESGSDFGELAKKYSDDPTGMEGGSLGLLALSDLSSEIRDAVESLDSGETSDPVRSESGVKFFHLDQRYSDDDDELEEAMRTEARKALQGKKTEDRLSSFFVTELYKNHAVEKKM